MNAQYESSNVSSITLPTNTVRSSQLVENEELSTIRIMFSAVILWRDKLVSSAHRETSSGRREPVRLKMLACRVPANKLEQAAAELLSGISFDS